MTPITRLDREAVKIIYFRAETTETIASIEVSWDDGATWTQLEATPDQDSRDAYALTVRGPGADSTAGTLLAAGPNHGAVRVVDSPEIEVSRFRIDVA